MTRTVPSFAEEGLKRFLHGMDRRIKDLERGGDWNFDEDPVDIEAIRESSIAARLLSMSVTGDSIASGGDTIDFNTVVAQHGAGWTVSTGQWNHPRSGVYVLSLGFEWDTYEGGGTVELLLAGTPVRTIDSSTEGKSGNKTIGYYAEQGTVGSIRVTQSSGSDQTCAATVDVMLPDPVDTAASVVSTSTSAALAESTRPVTVTVDAPTDVEPGDVMFAFVLSIEPSITSPSGWTRKDTRAGTGDYRFALDWKMVTSDDVGADFSWTVTGGTVETEVMVMVIAVRGVTGTDPFAGTPGFAGGASRTQLAPTTTAGTGALLLLALAGTTETIPGSADHSCASMVRAGFSSADSSNLTVAVSAFTSDDITTSPTITLGTLATEAGSYVMALK